MAGVLVIEDDDRKIEQDPRMPRRLVTVRGMGYKLQR